MQSRDLCTSSNLQIVRPNIVTIVRLSGSVSLREYSTEHLPLRSTQRKNCAINPSGSVSPQNSYSQIRRGTAWTGLFRNGFSGLACDKGEGLSVLASCFGDRQTKRKPNQAQTLKMWGWNLVLVWDVEWGHTSTLCIALQIQRWLNGSHKSNQKHKQYCQRFCVHVAYCFSCHSLSLTVTCTVQLIRWNDAKSDVRHIWITRFSPLNTKAV